jgi:hypothetical protein
MRMGLSAAASDRVSPQVQENEGAERCRRRTALAALLRANIADLLDQLIPEATRASGLADAIRNGYMAGAQDSVDLGLRALEADDEERAALLEQLVGKMAATSRGHRVPAIVERGLVSIGLRWALTQVRDRAPEHGFAPADLEEEFIAFRSAFEEKLR